MGFDQEDYISIKIPKELVGEMKDKTIMEKKEVNINK